MSLTPDAILEAISKETGIERGRLIPGATLTSLEIASLDMVSALFAIEDEFQVEVHPDDAAKADTLQDLIDIIMQKASATK